MAGLLDWINTPEGQGLLAAGFGGLAGARRGQPINSLGRAGLAGLGGYTGAQDRAVQLADSGVKRQYMQSQIDENLSQNSTRAAALKRQQEQDAYFMGNSGSGLLADAPSSPGAYAPSVDGMGPVAPKPATGVAPTMGKFDEWSTQFGIPKDALLADYRANGGKGIADMLYKRGTPDMTVSNGYVFDKNRQGAGYLPSLTTSTTGQTSMTQIGPDGMPVVSAPRGALDTYGAYKAADAGLKPIKVYNPVTQREEFTSEANVVGVRPGGPVPMAGPAGSVQSPAYAGGSRDGANAESIRMIQSELQNPNLGPQDRAALTREIVRLQQQSPGIGMAAGPSAAEATANKAAETKAVDTAKADVVRDTNTQKKEMSAAQMIEASRRARELLQQGPTASGIGEMADKTAAFFGKSTKGAEVAAKLDIVSGDLVNNVPRMEGPQSDGDRLEYKTQAGRAADRSLPVDQRIAALDEVERLQTKYSKYNGGTVNGGADGSWDSKPPGPKPPTPMKGMVRNGYKFKGGDPADKANWEKQ